MSTLFYFVLILQYTFGQNCGPRNSKGDAICPEVGPDLSNIIRPCPDFNVTCVQQWFDSHATCQPPLQLDDPVLLQQLVVYLPSFNATDVEGPAQHFYVNSAEIIEFYVNLNTKYTVLGVRYPRAVCSGNSTLLYYPIGMEPVRVSSEFKYIYENVVTTTVFQGTVNLDLSLSVTTAYLPGNSIADGRTFGCVNDPEVQCSIDQILCEKSKVTQESFLTIGPIMSSIYIQRELCNFGYDFTLPLYNPTVLL